MSTLGIGKLNSGGPSPVKVPAVSLEVSRNYYGAPSLVWAGNPYRGYHGLLWINRLFKFFLIVHRLRMG